MYQVLRKALFWFIAMNTKENHFSHAYRQFPNFFNCCLAVRHMARHHLFSHALNLDFHVICFFFSYYTVKNIFCMISFSNILFYIFHCFYLGVIPRSSIPNKRYEPLTNYPYCQIAFQKDRAYFHSPWKYINRISIFARIERESVFKNVC